MVAFTSDVSQNKYLPAGGTEVHAVVTVTAADDRGAGTPAGPGTGGPGSAAEVILLDCSGSMSGRKIKEAANAAAVAIDTLRDGVAFAVVEGTHRASMIYPRETALAVASAETRAAARAAVGRLRAHGGTSIGEWLLLARELMLARPDAIHHTLLLTDGQNGEDENRFTQALARCEGVFQCDCRGVGADWSVAQLRQVAQKLLGSVELLREPAQMAADFQAVIAAAMGREVDRVALRLWAPKGATVRFVRQVLPEVDDLTARATEVSPLVRDYPTGAWGAGTRAYHLCVDVPAGPVGAEKLAARVSLVVGDDVLSTAKVLAAWTDDAELSTQMDKVVAHYTGQAELARAIQEGLEARQEGDLSTAATRLGIAARLAAAAGDSATLARLDKVVEIEDAATGKVVLRGVVDKLDEMDLDAKSTRTVPAPK
ncbi:VWA domain-containing protein [Frankia sp. CNm7]|uniref:VWA domain-containing protein n=1 Tax=Frankia nepalensis TaxID=1836974 RepID=A0A937UUK1_9ACTN|nr:VWA domain-containing protein [Frankia nepalensis]MBL7500462.1 VWA domain-containing protein [Frankia nepalensis]MBL7516442.1 VWA domain-containing protein [Frankia nepalensis]MBL7521903.1 VWA domain-containing protein [Frankia nepalensis]MBL7631246.1 VWA domain-containing protein [Frankia nepalensis]